MYFSLVIFNKLFCQPNTFELKYLLDLYTGDFMLIF